MAVESRKAGEPHLAPTARLATLAEVDRDSWAALVAGKSLFSSYPWLRMLEQRTTLPVEYLLWHREGGELIAALPLYAGPAKELPAPADPRRLFGFASSEEYADEHVVLAGTAYGYLNDGVLVRPEVPATERAGLVAAMVAEVRAAAAAADGYSAFLFLAAEDTNEIIGTGYGHDAVGLLSTSAVLDLPTGAFDDYLETLSKGMRWKARKERRLFEASGIQWAPARVPDDLAEIAALIELTYQHHGYPARDPARTLDLLEKQFAWFGEDNLLLLCRLGERLVGALSGFSHRDVLAVPWVGLDYDVDRDAALYYNLTYYRPIEYGMSRGFRSIDLGIGALNAKLRRGARLRPTWGLVEPPARLASRWSELITAHNNAGLDGLREQFGDGIAQTVADQWLGERAPRSR